MSVDVAKIFEQLGGALASGGVGVTGAAGGIGLAVELRLTEGEAAAGVTRLVDVRRPERCDACEGRGGTTPDAVAKPCDACEGKGWSEHAEGFFVAQQRCAACDGRKRVFAAPCRICDAWGFATALAQVSVTVPAGTTHGSSIRVPGAGGYGGPDAPRGDLFVHVLVGDRPNPHDVVWAGVEPPASELPAARARVRGEADRAGGGRMLLLVALAVLAALVVLALVR